jgi:hypothetical protein
MKVIQFKSTERGEGQIGSIIMLIVVIAAAVAASQVGPEDKLTEIAGRFPPNKDGDLRAKAAIKKAVEEAGLLPYLDPETCTVTSAGGIGGLRTVSCVYTREYKLFGSKKSKTFDLSISRPMF